MSAEREAVHCPVAPISGRIGVVGPCASGKTVLVEKLLARGYDARQCAQEHSYVGDMWQRICQPQVLVYLDVSLEATRRRRRIDYAQGYLDEQLRRLAHARQHCDVYVPTDELREGEVLARVVQALDVLEVGPHAKR